MGESVACIRGVEKELRRDFESVWGKERASCRLLCVCVCGRGGVILGQKCLVSGLLDNLLLLTRSIRFGDSVHCFKSVS